VNLDFLSINLKERIVEAAFYETGLTSVIFSRIWMKRDLDEEGQTMRLFLQVRENSRDFFNQPQYFAIS
jgi:hypothetical protein